MLTGAVALAVTLLAASASTPATSPLAMGEGTDPAIVDGTAQRELNAARERWKASGTRSYRMRVALECFCPTEIRRPRTLTVRDGRPVPSTPRHLRRYATVSRQFARIQEAIDVRARILTVAYRPDGAPRRIYVDRSGAIIDEELGIRVDRFRVGG